MQSLQERSLQNVAHKFSYDLSTQLPHLPLSSSNRIDYPWNKSMPTADLTTAKLLFNSAISTPGALFYSINLANFYFNTPMERYEYMRLWLDILPQEIIDKYTLNKIVDANGWVYVKICKGMYGLPQAGILTNKLLKKRLTIRGYYQCQHTPILWCHIWRDITFCLVVDDFGIKMTSMANMIHLVSSLQEHYSITVDWTGSLFCGVKLTWDYINPTVDLHMPDYISKALLKYQHQVLSKPQHAPYKATPIQFGAQVQTVTMDTTAPLSKECIKRMQDIVGTLLYYRCMVDLTILPAISAIAPRQAQGMEDVAKTCHQLLDYVATHSTAGIHYLASNMILGVHTNASYLSEHSACRAHFYLTNKGGKEFNNGTILNLASIIKHVMSLASEAESAALYYGCKIAVPIQTTLDKNGAHTTYDAHHDRQHYSTRSQCWHHDPEDFQINRPMLPLVKMLQCLMTVPILMAPRHPPSRRLHQ